MSMIRVASIYPTLLGTYGDGGNVAALAHRAALHDIPVEIIEVIPGMAVPRQADLYLLGGGEDTAQVAAATALRADGGLADAAARGATVLAICAGYQLLGEYFPDATGSRTNGLGILDIRTDRLLTRAVGELVAAPDEANNTLGITELFTGYENHAGATHRGPGVVPLGTVLAGVGNGDGGGGRGRSASSGKGTEGSVLGRIIGTYLHGPCLARNPQLADRLISWVVGRELPSIPEPEVEALRQERLRAVLG